MAANASAVHHVSGRLLERVDQAIDNFGSRYGQVEARTSIHPIWVVNGIVEAMAVWGSLLVAGSRAGRIPSGVTI